MNFGDLKSLYLLSCLALCLVILSPALALVVNLPGGESFSELWILGPGHMAEDYPFSVSAGEPYSVYLGVCNHMGSSAYYVVYVKFRNQTEPLPNATAGTPSPLPPLFEFRLFVEDGKSWEGLLRFSFFNFSFSEGRSYVGSLMINGVTFNVDKSASWDSENNGYYYQLFIELWMYNVKFQAFEFHNRFVGLWLNMTAI
ncbi:MAG: DUF1616 domain-containing protein [Candidatus Bathycorpusculaceae bacterium]